MLKETQEIYFYWHLFLAQQEFLKPLCPNLTLAVPVLGHKRGFKLSLPVFACFQIKFFPLIVFQLCSAQEDLQDESKTLKDGRLRWNYLGKNTIFFSTIVLSSIPATQWIKQFLIPVKPGLHNLISSSNIPKLYHTHTVPFTLYNYRV